MSPHKHIPHPRVPHPRDLLHKQPGLRLLPPGLGLMAKLTNRLAFIAAALYGSAATIVVFLLYSVLSGLAKGNLQITLLTWSNGVQLIFCAVMTYVGNQLAKQQQAKADADHEAQTHMATQIDQVADRLDEHTQGGIKAVLDAIDALPGKLAPAPSVSRKLQRPGGGM